jgi:hypothetical protein
LLIGSEGFNYDATIKTYNLKTMITTATLAKLATQHPAALYKLNIKLQQNNLPFYHLGGTNFNTLYRTYPAPRYVFKWSPPFLHLEEIYISYKADSNEQLDIVYKVATDSIEITEKRHPNV